MIMPYKIFIRMGTKTPKMIASKGRMVETPRRSKIEIIIATKDAARQAHTVCTPIGIFAKARFIACKSSVEGTLSNKKRFV